MLSESERHSFELAVKVIEAFQAALERFKQMLIEMLRES